MNSLNKNLGRLSAAEEFLDFFGIPYDQEIVNVSRLHILKRFYQYTRRDRDVENAGEEEQRLRYRELLARAYQDFVESSPAQEKVFKVFQDVAGQQISLDSLRQRKSIQR